MSGEERIAGGRSGATCPFCGEAWTAAMLDRYDAMIDPNGCACCGSTGHVAGLAQREARPVSDAVLCCVSCGRSIFRALALL